MNSFFLQLLEQICLYKSIDFNSTYTKLQSMKTKLNQKWNKYPVLFNFVKTSLDHVSLIDVVWFCMFKNIKLIFMNVEMVFLNKFFSIQNGDVLYVNLVNKRIVLSRDLPGTKLKKVKKSHGRFSRRRSFKSIILKKKILKNLTGENPKDRKITYYSLIQHLTEVMSGKQYVYGVSSAKKSIVGGNSRIFSENTNSDKVLIDSADITLIKVKYTNKDLSSYYDCDGMCAIFEPSFLDKCFKNGMILDFSTKNNFRLLQRSLIIFVNGSPIKLKKLYNFKIGMVPTDFGNVNVFVCLKNELTDEEEYLMKERLYYAIKEFFLTFKFSPVDASVINYMTIKDCSIYGNIQNNILKLLKCVFDKTLGGSRFFFYIELYNTKTMLKDANSLNLLFRIGRFFNFNNFNDFTVDICKTISSNNPEHTIFLPENFVSCVVNYNLLLCENLSNYNGSLIKLNKNGKIKGLESGLKKLNFYSTIISTLIETKIRKQKFPLNSQKAFFDYYLELNQKGSSINNLIADLLKTFKAVNERKSSTYGYRMELTTSIFNILDIEDIYEKILYNNSIVEVKTSDLNQSILSNLDFFIEKLQSYNQRKSVKNFFNLIVWEIILFEFLLKGGKNLHIIPKDLKHAILCLKQPFNFPKDASYLKSLSYEYLPVDSMLQTFKKLVMNSSLNPSDKKLALEIVYFAFMEERDKKMDLFSKQILIDLSECLEMNTDVFIFNDFNLYERKAYNTWIQELLTDECNILSNMKYRKFLKVLLKENEELTLEKIAEYIILFMITSKIRYGVSFVKRAPMWFLLHNLPFNSKNTQICSKDAVIRGKRFFNSNIKRKVSAKEIGIILGFKKFMANSRKIYDRLYNFLGLPFYIIYSDDKPDNIRWNENNWVRKLENPEFLEEKNLVKYYENNFNFNTFSFINFVDILFSANIVLTVDALINAEIAFCEAHGVSYVHKDNESYLMLYGNKVASESIENFQSLQTSKFGQSSDVSVQSQDGDESKNFGETLNDLMSETPETNRDNDNVDFEVNDEEVFSKLSAEITTDYCSEILDGDDGFEMEKKIDINFGDYEKNLILTLWKKLKIDFFNWNDFRRTGLSSKKRPTTLVWSALYDLFITNNVIIPTISDTARVRLNIETISDILSFNSFTLIQYVDKELTISAAGYLVMNKICKRFDVCSVFDWKEFRKTGFNFKIRPSFFEWETFIWCLVNSGFVKYVEGGEKILKLIK